MGCKQTPASLLTLPFLIVVIAIVGGCGETAPKQTSPPDTSAANSKGKAEALERQVPTLAFNNTKDVSPIIDSDALLEEGELKKKLPGNQLVEYKRSLHETSLMQEFTDGFRDSPECNGITFYRDREKANTVVQIHVYNHDTPGHEQEWFWMLFDGPDKTNKKDSSLSGMGNQSTAKLTARDVCLTMWENIDPNHFKKPGGIIN